MESNNPITSKQMEHVRNYERRDHAVLKMGNDLRPADGEGCVGKAGIDKSFSLQRIMEIAYKLEPKPNLLIKGGKNAKWYLKRCPIDLIESKNHCLYVQCMTGMTRSPTLILTYMLFFTY